MARGAILGRVASAAASAGAATVAAAATRQRLTPWRAARWRKATRAALSSSSFSLVRPVGGAAASLREVPDSVPKPPYAATGVPPPKQQTIPVHTPADIEGIRAACRVARQALDFAVTLVAPGVTTDEIDRLVHEFIVGAGAYPSPLNYMGFPKSVCTSVNNVVVHGIPDSRPLEATDLVNIDVSVFYGGYHGDCSATVGLPELDDAGVALLACARDALHAGIGAVRAGQPLNTVGKAVEATVMATGCDIVREFIGHGIGRDFHAPPDVHHYDVGALRSLVEPTVAPGMVFTIEPPVTEGGRGCAILEDGWTAITVDGLRSAQFEHTVLVTEDGVAEILTVA